MPTYREELAERIAGILAPMPGANPAGADISYDPDFESVKAEIDKLSSVDNTEPAWSRIDQLGTQLLAHKGKDLRVVAWLTVARAKTSSWRGFAESLLMFDGLARAFWDTMYPEARRARARLNAIAWMADMVHQAMQGQDVSLADADAVRTCDELVNELDRLLSEKLGDAYTGPGQLRSMMREKVAAIPAPPPEPVATPEGEAGTATQVEQPSAVATSGATGPVAPTSADGVEAAVVEYGRLVCESANVLRNADRASPWAFKLMRLGAWLPIKQQPPAQGVRTDVYAPDGYMRDELQNHVTSESWSDLCASAEGRVQSYPLWLDLHRYLALAMEKLGAEFAAARQVVGSETVRFVASMPDLLSFEFSDGTPFADPQTQAWLAEEAAKYRVGSKASAAINREDEEIAARFAEAQQLSSNGRVADGLSLGLALAERAPDARLRFRARLGVAKMAIDAAKHDLARGMLEQMLHDVERHGLETWEPATCATLYSQLLVATREVSRAKGETPELTVRQQQLFDKLCRLDPAAAIRLSS